ncbi:hypothetical protein FACS1894127_1730 [Clostridia bacterium]|nr:hypothetical protein FACS1894127_1730 [Clostridia bacterium]
MAGIRPRDIPAELFDWAEIDDDISDIFVFETVCKRYEYLLDRLELGEARALMQILCNNSHSLPDTIKMPCYCELLFHELIGECRQEEIGRLYTKKLQDFIKAVHTEISVQRLMYAYACLVSKDNTKATEYLDSFYNACALTVFSGSVIFEKELIGLIDTQYLVDIKEKHLK